MSGYGYGYGYGTGNYGSSWGGGGYGYGAGFSSFLGGSNAITVFQSGGLEEIIITAGGSGWIDGMINIPWGWQQETTIYGGGGSTTYYSNQGPSDTDKVNRASGAQNKGSADYYAQFSANENPATVQISPEGNKMTVFYFPDGAHGLGHIAVGLNGSLAAGFQPRTGDISNVWSGPGYVALGADNAPGSVLPVLSITVNISVQQAQNLRDFMSDSVGASVDGGATYQVLNNNCAAFGAAAASSAGQSYGWGNLLPSIFYAEFQSGELIYNGSNVDSIQTTQR